MGHALYVVHDHNRSVFFRQCQEGSVQFFLQLGDRHVAERRRARRKRNEIRVALDAEIDVVEAHGTGGDALALLEEVDRAVDGDAIDPGVERRVALEVSERPVGLHEDVLDEILGVLAVAGHVVDQRVDLLLMTADELVVGVEIVLGGTGDERADFRGIFDGVGGGLRRIHRISNVLSGRGETGVRSKGHASELARLGSARPKKRALVIEDSLEVLATKYLKLDQQHNPDPLRTPDGQEFISEQFTKDFMVKVDAHSSSPVFMEDMKQDAMELFKAHAITRKTLVQLIHPPMEQEILQELKIIEKKEEEQKKAEAQAQQAQKKS